jgi:DNA mismatch repair protein MutS2
MVEEKTLELLQFTQIIQLVANNCLTQTAKAKALALKPITDTVIILNQLHQTNELARVLSASGYFPELEFEDIRKDVHLLSLQGALLSEEQLLRVCRTTEVANTHIRFLKGKKQSLPTLFELAADLEDNLFVVNEINRIIDNEGLVKNSASHELAKIRKQIGEKRRESDKRFYNYINEIRKLGFLRENEESYFNGRRTLSVLVEYKSEINGFVHSKSESGKTIFIEPSATIAVNNEVAELEIDEQREINRILRELCDALYPYAYQLKNYVELLEELDFIKARALFAIRINGVLPEIVENGILDLKEARHPLLYLQNKQLQKKTVPLELHLSAQQRLVVISGPNAGGKSISLKTVGLLQCMLQSGLLVSVKETSRFCFFENVLVDIGDTQSIENELSTYSAKLKSMIRILDQINENTLVLMDEFGSGTDPELGGAIAETVLESLVNSKTLGIITTHFSNVKIRAEQLDGALNASMLFDIESLEPLYILSVGEPGSSYTFEVAERIGFPKYLIERAKKLVNTENLKLNALLGEVQTQKAKLNEALEKNEHETFLKRIAKEKYDTLFQNWQTKIDKERDRKIELARLADYGMKYLRLMDDWNEKKDKKIIIKRFIDGITAETRKQDELRKQKKLDNFAEKKIERIKPKLKIGSKVKILNGTEIGVIEEIKDQKVFIKFGLMKMTVGMENLVLAE